MNLTTETMKQIPWLIYTPDEKTFKMVAKKLQECGFEFTYGDKWNPHIFAVSNASPSRGDVWDDGKLTRYERGDKPHHKINILDINYKTSISGFTCDKFKNEEIKYLKAEIKRLEEKLQEWESQ